MRQLIFAIIVALAFSMPMLKSSSTYSPTKHGNSTCHPIECEIILTRCAITCSCDFLKCQCCPACKTCMGDMFGQCCGCFGMCNKTNIN